MKIDERYVKLARIAEDLPTGQLTCAELMDHLELKYSHHYLPKQWVEKVNEIIDCLVNWEFIEYKNGFYENNRGDQIGDRQDDQRFIYYKVSESFSDRVLEKMRDVSGNKSKAGVRGQNAYK